MRIVRRMIANIVIHTRPRCRLNVAAKKQRIVYGLILILQKQVILNLWKNKNKKGHK